MAELLQQIVDLSIFLFDLNDSLLDLPIHKSNSVLVADKLPLVIGHFP